MVIDISKLYYVFLKPDSDSFSFQYDNMSERTAAFTKLCLQTWHTAAGLVLTFQVQKTVLFLQQTIPANTNW